jgi:hypothetical protein
LLRLVAEAVMVIVGGHHRSTGRCARTKTDLRARVLCARRSQCARYRQPQSLYLIALQSFDGVAAGDLGVLLKRVTADLAAVTVNPTER